MKRYLLILLFLSAHDILAQGFQKLYGGINQESVAIAIPAEGENIYFLGATTSNGAGNADITLIKVDKTGEKIWARTYGSTNWDAPSYMVKASDGVAIIGSSQSFSGDQSQQLLFFKTDTAGAVLWSKVFSTGTNSNGNGIALTHDNGYIITGTARVNGISKVVLIRTNSNGDTLFTRIYGSNTTSDIGIDVKETPDHGFIITGKTIVSNFSDVLLIKTDSAGHIEWTQGYGSNGWEEGESVDVTSGNGYVVCGATNGYGQGGYDILAMKFDGAGSVTWSKAIGGKELEASYSIKEHADQSIILSGYTSSFGYGHPYIQRDDFNKRQPGRILGNDSINLLIIKLDANGDTIWSQSYGHGKQDEGFHFSDMPDGGFLMTGYSYSFNEADSSQMFLVRTDSLGYSGCHEKRINPGIVDALPVTKSLSFSEEAGLNVGNVTLQHPVWNIVADDACAYYTAVPDPPLVQPISIYPNPVQHTIHIDGISSFNYEIRNLQGQLIKHGSGSGTIDVSSLASGCYLLHLMESNTMMKVVIVNN